MFEEWGGLAEVCGVCFGFWFLGRPKLAGGKIADMPEQPGSLPSHPSPSRRAFSWGLTCGAQCHAFPCVPYSQEQGRRSDYVHKGNVKRQRRWQEGLLPAQQQGHLQQRHARDRGAREKWGCGKPRKRKMQAAVCKGIARATPPQESVMLPPARTLNERRLRSLHSNRNTWHSAMQDLCGPSALQTNRSRSVAFGCFHCLQSLA